MARPVFMTIEQIDQQLALFVRQLHSDTRLDKVPHQMGEYWTTWQCIDTLLDKRLLVAELDAMVAS